MKKSQTLLKNKLKNAVVYLAGPIDRADDLGRGWRKDFTNAVRSSFLDLVILDPTNKPDGLLSETEEEHAKVVQLSNEGKWDEVCQYVAKIQRADLRCVDMSDFLVLYIDVDIHMTGSYDEAFKARDQKKPVLIICKGGIKKVPKWLFANFKPSEMFASTDECLEYLEKLALGEIELDDRWVLIRKYIVDKSNER